MEPKGEFSRQVSVHQSPRRILKQILGLFAAPFSGFPTLERYFSFDDLLSLCTTPGCSGCSDGSDHSRKVGADEVREWISLNDRGVFDSDSVWFYAHKSVIDAASSNHFGGLLAIEQPEHEESVQVAPQAPPLLTVVVPEDSVVFNILLHLIYKL